MSEFFSLISIIIPCYNQAQYLDEALQSVFDQTYNNWECIIVNDGSLDNTEEVAKNWVSSDRRFKYLYQENGGLSSARNYGLNNAIGNWIQFLDSDDILDNRKLELSLIEVNSNNKVDKLIIISNYSLFTITPLESIFMPEFNDSLFNFETVLYKWDDYLAIPIHCGFFEVSLFENFRFPEHIKAKEDWIMWVSLFHNGAKVIHINKSLALYRKHSDSMTMTSDILSEYIKAYEYLKLLISEEEYHKLSLALFSKYFRKSLTFNKNQNSIKQSNTYKVGYLIKKSLRKLGILKPAKYLFEKTLKLKAVSKYL